MIHITEVTTKAQLRQFVNFPIDLYRDVPQYIPGTYSDDLADWDREKNPAFSYCEARCWLASRDDGTLVGRIGAILSRKSNDKWGTHRLRFTQVDFIDDREVSAALFQTVEDWARQLGCTEIHGPLGFTDMDREGMLVEGFDRTSCFFTYYNHPYYIDHLTALGYGKDVDWTENLISVPTDQRVIQRWEKIAAYVLKRQRLHIHQVRSRLEYPPLIRKVFELVNVAYAPLYGTVELLEADERARIRGLIINKFRGDVEILRPGLAMLEEKTQLPVVGVVPYLRVEIEDEDSLSDRLEAKSAVKPLDIAILRLPHVSNFTDFIPLEQHPLLGVRYVQHTRQLGAPDLVILPGTKNTMDDLRWLRESGLEAAVLRLSAAGTPVLGVCGGYQMLGEELCDPAGEESGTPCTLRGLGLLPTTTVFGTEKHLTQTAARAAAAPFAGAALTGYEIHAGRTEVRGSAFCTLADGTPEGCVQGNVFGTYLHGLFDTGELTEKLTAFLCRKKGIDPAGADLIPMEQYRQQQFDLLADGVRAALDLPAVYAAMGLAGPKGENA